MGAAFGFIGFRPALCGESALLRRHGTPARLCEQAGSRQTRTVRQLHAARLHHIFNRAAADALLRDIGDCVSGYGLFYPADALAAQWGEGGWRFESKDGRSCFTMIGDGTAANDDVAAVIRRIDAGPAVCAGFRYPRPAVILTPRP